jgi:hypothetical protein
MAKLVCDFCGHVRNERVFERTSGINRCESCGRATDGGIRWLRRHGSYEWEAETNEIVEGYDYRRSWVKVRGTLEHDSGLEAGFAEEKRGLGERIGRMFGAKPEPVDLQVGHPDFDDKVLIMTSDRPTTARFLEDEAVRSGILNIVDRGGSVGIHHKDFRVDVDPGRTLFSQPDWRWCESLLFSGAAIFSRLAAWTAVQGTAKASAWPNVPGLVHPDVDPEAAESVHDIPVEDRRAFCREFLAPCAAGFDGRIDESDHEVRCELSVGARKARVEVAPENGAVAARISMARTGEVLHFVHYPGRPRGDVESDEVSVGKHLWACVEDGTREQARAEADRLGPERVEQIRAFMEKRGIYRLEVADTWLSVCDFNETATALDRNAMPGILRELADHARMFEEAAG